MKKSFILGLLLAVVMAVGSTAFTSCKDNVDDINLELDKQKVKLADLEKLLGEYKALADNCQQTIDSCQKKCKEITDSLAQVTSSKADTTALENLRTALEALIAAKADSATVDQIQRELYTLTANYQKLVDNGVTSLTAEEVASLKTIAGLTESLTNLVGMKDQLAALADKKDDILGLLGMKESLTKLIDMTASLETLTGKTQDILDAIDNAKVAASYFENIGMTPAEFQEAVKNGNWVATNKDAMEKILNTLNQDLLNSLTANAKYLNSLGDFQKMYDTLFPNGITEGTEWWSMEDIMKNVKDNASAIQALQSKVGKLNDRLNSMVTSLVLQATSNPVFSGFNTPVGLNSMVLMTYFGQGITDLVTFPNTTKKSAEYNGTDVTILNWDVMLKGAPYELPDGNIVDLEDGKASLGKLYFTVNPGTVEQLDFNGFNLVNSKEDVVPVSLLPYKEDEKALKFGYESRAFGNGNGLFATDVKIAPEDLNSIKINIEPGLKDALIDAVKNRKLADFGALAQKVLQQFKDVCDANALRYTYNSYDIDALGNETQRVNKVYSNYGLAATAFKPLGYATLHDKSFSNPFPTINPITLDKSLVNLNLKPFVIGDIHFDIDLNISDIKIDNVGATIVSVKVPKKFDVNVDKTTGEGEAVLPEGWENMPGYYDIVNVDIADELNEVIDTLRTNINEWLNGNGTDTTGLADQINKAVQDAIDNAFNGPDGLVTSIQDQVNDMMGSIQDKLYSLVDKVNNDYLGRINRLIERYNDLASRFDRLFEDPNQFLQATMVYRKANGGLGRLSQKFDTPTLFSGNGEAIEIWATSYDLDLFAPALKKFVGVNAVYGVDEATAQKLVAQANDPNNLFAKVIPGTRSAVALNVQGAPKGAKYEIVYQALDYMGATSTVKCYIQIN